MAITDKLTRVSSSTSARPTVPTLSAPGHSIGGNSITISAATNWDETTAVHFTIYETTSVGGVTVKDTTTQTDWKGTLSGTTISNMTLTGGTDRNYSAGAIVEQTPTARWARDLHDWGTQDHDVDGYHKTLHDTNGNEMLEFGVTASAVNHLKISNATTGNAVVVEPAGDDTNIGLTLQGKGTGKVSADLDTWTSITDTITYDDQTGDKSYTLTASGVDLTGDISKGMKLKVDRSTTPPTQSYDFDTTESQYANKASPTGITFTDDFTCEAWIKLSSRPSAATYYAIVSRFSGSGWILRITDGGKLQIVGDNSGASIDTYQSDISIPLNKWVHVAGYLDLSASDAKLWLNGEELDGTYTNGGTTSLTQAGDLEIGSYGGASFFNGKITEVRLWNDIRTVQEVRDNMNIQLAGTESNLVGYWKLNSDLTDSDSNGNDLTANGTPSLSNTTDHPFNATEYAVVTDISYSTDTTITVDSGDGYNIPNETLDSPAYSAYDSPLGWPTDDASLLATLNSEAFSLGLGDWVQFAPSWQDITVGNGDNWASYTRIGRTVIVQGGFTAGSTSSASYSIQHTAPVQPSYCPVTRLVGHFEYVDASSSGVYHGRIILTVGGSADFNLSRVVGSNIDDIELDPDASAVPVQMATGDVIRYTYMYEARV